MFSSGEKTNPASTTVQQKTQQQTFFRKAGEGSFFDSKEQPSFFNAPVQAKLSVSSPDDPQEKEADAMADKVMRMPEPASTPVNNKEEEKLQKKEEEKKEEAEPVQAKLYSAPVDIQAKCESCEKEESLHAKRAESLQRKEEKEEEQVSPKLFRQIQRSTESSGTSCGCENSAEGTDTRINRKNISLHHSDIVQRSGRGPPADSIPFDHSLSSSKGGGSALPGDSRQFMESRFNADFSGVRIHTGSHAESMSRQINAQAFTHGNDIYFNSGKYSPSTSAGGTLLAHELTHTIQQGSSKHNSSSGNKIHPRLEKANNPSRRNSKTATPVSAAIQQASREAGSARNKVPPGPVPYQQINNGAKNNRQPDNKAPPGATGDPKRKNNKGAKAQKNNAGRLNRKKAPAAKKKGKSKPAKKADDKKKKSKGRSPKTGKGKKQNARKGKNKKAKPISIRINASELKAKKGQPAIASRYRHSQQVIDSIQRRGAAARENFAVNVSGKTGLIQTHLTQQHDTLVQTGAEQEGQLRDTFSSAKDRITTVIDGSSERVSSHGASQGEALSSSHTASIENVNTVFNSGHENVNNITNTYANRSTEVANAAANLFQSNVQAAINEINQVRDSKNSNLDSDPDVADAQREAANTVASDTADKVSEGLTDGMNGLIASGPETANEFTNQGAEAANQLMSGKAEVDTQVNQVFTNATQTIGQMTSGAVQSIQQQKTPILSQFETLEDGLLTQLNQQVDQKVTDLQQAGQQIMTSFRQQSEQSLTASDSHVTQMSQQLSTINVAEKEAPKTQNFAEQDISNAYSSLNTSLDNSTRSVTTEVRQRGNQVVTAVQSISAPVTTQVNTSVAQNDAQIRQAESQSISQITEGASQAINGANNVVSQVSTGLTQQVSSIDTNFQQGLDGYNTGLLNQVGQGTINAREPIGTLPARMDSAQQRAAERARRSWLENQWADVVELVSDPGFWAGLLVGILLVALVIFLEIITLGTATVVIIAIAAAIGGIAAGVGSIVGQAMNHSFSGGWDWSRVKPWEVVKAVLIGAAAGAAFAIVGIIAVEGFGVAATGFGMIAIMSITSGIVGIITNKINGQPWDKGLLFNIALGGLLTWLMGKIPTRSGNRAPPTEDQPPEPPRPIEPIPGEPIIVEQQNIKATSPNTQSDSVSWQLYDEASGATFAWQEVEVSPTGTPEGGPHQTLTPKEAVLPDGSVVPLKSNGFSWTEVSVRMMLDMFERIFGARAPNLSGAIAWDNLRNFQAEFAKIKTANPSLSELQVGNQAVRQISYGRARIDAGYGKLSVEMSGRANYTLPDGTVVEVPASVYVNALPD